MITALVVYLGNPCKIFTATLLILSLVKHFKADKSKE